jgi:predicted nucleic-acid-binding protein
MPQPKKIIAAISGLLEAADILLIDEAAIEEGLYTWKHASTDFADCQIGAKNRRMACRTKASFDVKADNLHGFIVV